MGDNTPKTRRRKRPSASGQRSGQGPVTAGLSGGRYCPLNVQDLPKIDTAVRRILIDTGVSEAPDIVIEHVTAGGGKLSSDGRLTFSAGLIDDALNGLSRNFTLHGQKPGHELHLSGKRVHVGTGGAAPSVLDLQTERYRDSTLRDLYDVARLVDELANIHFFSRSLVARDMPNLHSLDINTAYACLAGTVKHVFVSASLPEHVAEIADMCFRVAGSAEAFAEKPFLSLNINHVVPPLRLDGVSCEVMAQAARLGIPIHANTFGQLGASSPVTIAGSVAQTVAETLAGMIFAWLVNPNARVVFGARPMVTDLRTGAMTGGGGEQAVLTAASVQMAHYYDLPNSTIAGAADSKLSDAQSGYEKALTVSLAAQAGSNLVTQAAGMQASLMGCSFESYVIDNDMLGGILRSIADVEVSDATLALAAIDAVVRGEGHFLGEPDTLARMQTDFLYPQVANRHNIEQWESEGANDIRTTAKVRTLEILSSHFPRHLSGEMDRSLRSSFDIRLPQSAMTG